MIKDTKQWNIGLSKLSAFMTYHHEPFDEEHVKQYHEIVKMLEDASGEDFSHFRIAADKLNPKKRTQIRTDFSSGSEHAIYSDKKYCDAGYFRSQIGGLASYVPLLRGNPSATEANPYESLNDHQLQELLVNRKIKPKRVIDGRGESYVFERAYAIAELLKSDRPKEPTASVSNVFNIHGSNIISSSPGASITQDAGMKSEELRKIIADLKQLSVAQGLSPENRVQMNIDIGTIELQLNSPRPNPSFVKSSLESARVMLETASGTFLGEAAIIAIKHYLNIP